jgi:hypothetical protein
MAPDDELVNLIDFSAHGPDRGQLFVESYPIRPAPPLVSAVQDVRHCARRADMQERVLAALTGDWSSTAMVASRAQLPYETTRHALYRLAAHRAIQRHGSVRGGKFGKTQQEWRRLR